mmetsp:Transcript_27473/g.44253  ORF Transcript_27473/g.44253 Transcript_27473/m.44253 type:complete len:310 (-) Transcript_27473:357-1286(-)
MDTADAERRLPLVQTVPLIRLKLFQSLRQIDAESFKNYVLAHVLESRHLHLPSVYDMLGSSQMSSADINSRVFTLWIHEALGETTFQRGVVQLIFEYFKPCAISPRGLRYELTLSGPYGDPRIPSNYETLVDEKHGFPGAATNHRIHPWIQAVFEKAVQPRCVIVSEPTMGAFQEGGWGVGYLTSVRIAIPEREIKDSRSRKRKKGKKCMDVATAEDADFHRDPFEPYAYSSNPPRGPDAKGRAHDTVTFPEEGRRWIIVGDVANAAREGLAIRIPIALPSGYDGARTFRLYNFSTHAAWLATGSFIFE